VAGVEGQASQAKEGEKKKQAHGARLGCEEGKAKSLNPQAAAVGSTAMLRTTLLCFGFTLIAGYEGTRAIDVDPSKNTIPRSSFDTGGNHFSIFNGDPKRIQRANEVDTKMFDAKVEITPNPLSLKVAHQVGPNPSVKINFYVHNHGKKTYTLSFPTAQRWDFRIVNAAGGVVYTYTDDHEFVQVVGASMVNENDKLSYTESVDFDDMTLPLTPGTYTVEAVLANYPEMSARVQFVVTD
jgi:hypothetical protein